MARPSKYPVEFRERAVRLVHDHAHEYPSQWAAIRFEMMVACVDAQLDTYGVESICAHLPIAPSTYWRHKAQEADPMRRAARVQRDAVLRPTIARVWHEQEQVYGAEKVWRQRKRDGVAVARCTVERVMKDLGLRGVVRGGPAVVTTSPDVTAAVPDLVDRQFSATRPNQL